MRQCLSIISIKRHFKYILLFALLTLQGFCLGLGAQTDSLHMRLDSSVFVSRRNTSAIKRSDEGALIVDMERMGKLPKLMGSVDPVRFVRLLPGVQTNSDSDAGIHIQGCDNSHNEISLGGVPVYGANHLLGLFSVFNPSHYQSMSYSGNSLSNRLGGMMEMTLPDPVEDKVDGDVSVGMMSAQGSVGFRMGGKSSLRLSARRSYLGLLYKPWLKINDSLFSYGFGDYDATYMYSSGNDRLWVDLYLGNDAVALDDSSYGFGISVGWGNAIGAVHWEHRSDNAVQKHSVYYSGYSSKADISQEDASAIVDSRIFSAGYKGSLEIRNFKAGAEIVYHDVIPQSPEIEGLFDDVSVRERQRAVESSLSGSYKRSFWGRLDMDAGLKASFYAGDGGHFFWGLSPRLAFSYDFFDFGKLSAEYGWKRQYLFQTGLTNIGFPLEFWLLPGKYSRPQYCQYAGISYETGLFDDMFTLSVDLYGKRLYNQLEYKGDMLDLFLSEYELEASLLKGKGWNYGINFNLHKRAGNPTGWISYSLGRSLRSFDNPEYPDIYPANHERIHELNAVCVYEYGRWDFSGTFIYAGGLPFTAPESFYLSSGKIMTLYGEHNGERMRPYIRLDLSVDFALTQKKGRESALNLSVHNVLGRYNEVMYRLYINDDGFSYDSMAFPLRFMPSLSYCYRF